MMGERCDSCGTELFAGQQFCRACGAPTRRFSPADIPTQILPGAQPAPERRGQTSAQNPNGTTPLGSRDTDSSYPSHFAQYQAPHATPPAPFAPTAPLAGKRPAWRGWLIAVVCLIAFFGVASIFAARFIGQRLANRQPRIIRVGAAPHVPPIPSMPALPGIAPAATAPDPDGVLDERGAEVSGDKTVITRTFPLKAGATFSLANVSGDITVEGWDGAGAEVRITKRGGSREERAGVEIMQEVSDDELNLKTSEETGGVREVRYEVKLSRGVGRVEISSRDSNVRVSNVGGGVIVNLLRGDIALEGVAGSVDTRTMKGDTSVDLKNLTPGEPQVFNAVNGSVELKVGGANAVVKVETISGHIDADDGLGLDVQKRLAGENAAGNVGKGGQSIVAKTISGNIKIRK